jgi:hypothetical protein
MKNTRFFTEKDQWIQHDHLANTNERQNDHY